MPYADYEKQKANSRENYLKNREKKIEQAKKYYATHKVKRDKQKKEWADRNIEKLREYRRAYYKKYYLCAESRKALAQSVHKWKGKNPLKVLCHYAVHNALRRGDIKKPLMCTTCQLERRLHAHHADYMKPLNVEWLCSICHTNKHKEKTNAKIY